MPEKWTPVRGYEVSHEVSTLGRVRSLARGVLRPVAHSGGYPGTSLCHKGRRRTTRIHRIVLESFRGPPGPGQEARHINGDKTDNRLSNLAWGTRSDNTRDQMAHGTWHHPKGESNGRSRLTDKIVRQCRARHSRGESSALLASEFGVARVTMRQALSGARWKHVPEYQEKPDSN